MINQAKEMKKMNNNRLKFKGVELRRFLYFCKKLKTFLLKKLEKKTDKDEDPNEFFENRVLKGLPPELIDVPDLKPLA